jgi:hypothetical protein
MRIHYSNHVEGSLKEGRDGERKRLSPVQLCTFLSFFLFYDRLYGVNWGFLAWMDGVLEAKRLGRLIMDNILK